MSSRIEAVAAPPSGRTNQICSGRTAAGPGPGSKKDGLGGQALPSHDALRVFKREKRGLFVRRVEESGLLGSVSVQPNRRGLFVRRGVVCPARSAQPFEVSGISSSSGIEKKI